MKNQPQSATLIEFGSFSFDKALGKLSKHGTPIRLGGMPLKILQHLVERPGEAVSRGELQSLLWNGAAFGDFEQGLNTAVNVVRKTLGDSADEAHYIETVPGHGYRFIAPIRPEVGVPEPLTSSVALDSDSKVVDADQGVESAHEILQEPVAHKASAPRSRWWIAAVLAMAALGSGVWWKVQSKPPGWMDGIAPSANKQANEQYEMAMNFLAVQNDLPLARKAFERAVELDPHFASARLQVVLGIVIELYNGYTNDGSVLLRAEEELHQAEQDLPASDGLLLAAQAGVYLAEGRLDRIPLAKMEEDLRKGGNPTWLVILRMLEGQTQEPLAILRTRVDRNPLEAPSRMFLGELLRMHLR